MRNRLLGVLGTLIAPAPLGCSVPAGEVDEESVAEVSAALDVSLVIATAFDDSASPVHIQLRNL